MIATRNEVEREISRRGALRGLAVVGGLPVLGTVIDLETARGASALLAPATPESTPHVEIPDTEAGRELASWLDAVNAYDPDALVAHHARYGPPGEAERRAAFDLLYARTWGALLLHRVDEVSARELTALVEATLSEEWLTVQVGGERGFGLAPAMPPPEALPPAPLDDGALAAELETYLARLSEADVFSGAVLVARDGEPIFSGAYGLANVALETANLVDTRFNLGSMNKMMTAVAIARLQEAGELSFDDPIARHLPDYPTAVAEQVTIHHLLTHTSGLGDIFGPRYLEEKDQLHALRDYLPLFIDAPLTFTPGERHEYSNAGFIVLGLIIEEITGQDYFDHVREYICRPAGMEATDFYERDAGTPNLAIGYTFPLPEDPADLRPADVLGGRVTNDAFLAPRGTSAGGGYSTVEDLLRFAQALRGETLLTAETVATLIEGKVATPPGPAVRYGYGFIDDRSGPERIVGHGGGAPGISARLDLYWDRGATVVTLSNYDGVAELVAMKARRLLTPG